MPTPGYAVKHWWRAERAAGESLKSFGRHFVGHSGKTTFAKWFQRKRNKKGSTS